MKIVNMTPHPVTVEGFETFQSQGSIRLEQHDTPAHDLDGIPVMVRRYGQSELPPQAEGTYYIVSQIVASAFPMRYDFVFPGDLIRDVRGNITGCKNLCRVP